MRSIRHSLRLRLMLFVSALVIAALVALAFVSTRVVSQIFARMQPVEDDGSITAALEDKAAALGDLYRRDGSFAAADTVVEGPYAGRAWSGLLVSPEGTLLFSVPFWAYDETRFRPDGALEAVSRVRPWRRGRQAVAPDEMVVQLDFPRAAIVGNDGRTLAYLFLQPDRGISGAVRPAETVWLVNRGVLAAAAVAAILALVATAVLSARVVRPIEELTGTVERLGRGDTSARAPVTRKDEIGALGASFNQMADNLERLEALRRRMLGDVAHELRTPLTNVRCQLEAIQDGLVAPSADTLASLHAELLALSRVVDDLQDLALADAGQLRLRVETVDAAALARQVARALASPGGPAVNVDAPAECPLQADGDRLRQVLRNLAANALAVTPPGGDVRMTVTSSAASVTIAVEDQGPGIPPGARELVFERFVRLDQSRSRAGGGAGLGLAIVGELVALHGGSIHVEAAAGGGARFVVRLPAVK